MKNILFFVLILVSTLVYAETIKSIDSNQTMSNEEFMKKMMAFEQRQNDAKAKTAKSQADLDASKKLGKTLDELINQLGIQNK